MAAGSGEGCWEDGVTRPPLCPRATLQVLHQACEAALSSGLVPGGSALAWASYYQDRLSSDQSCLNEWMAMADLVPSVVGETEMNQIWPKTSRNLV